MMHWTKELPTVDGYYWWREDLSRHAFCCHVERGKAYFPHGNEGELLAWLGGQWYGPLNEPDAGDAIENCPKQLTEEELAYFFDPDGDIEGADYP